MARRREDRKALQVRCYRYGLLSRVHGVKHVDAQWDLLFAQLRLGHQYRNKLVELERTRRDMYHALLAAHDPAVAEAAERVAKLEEMLDVARKAIQASRSGTRRREQAPEGKDVTSALWSELNEAYKTLRAAEVTARKQEDVRAAVEILEQRSREAARAVSHEYQKLGLYWGTRGAWDRVAKEQFRSGRPPRFRRFEGGGTLAVQLQSQGDRNGYSVADICGTGPNATQARRLVCLDLTASGRQGRQYGVLRIRIGSDGRDPVFASFPIVYHRPIPEAARIKWVRVIARPVAGNIRWSASFEVELPEEWSYGAHGTGSVALDIGWARVADEGRPTVRVARWVGSDGVSGEVVVPVEVLGQVRKADDLRSIRDKHFNAMKAGLSVLVRQEKLDDEERAQFANLSAWRSPGRVVRALHWFRGRETPGAAAIRSYLEAWYVKDRHLWEWEANARRKALARRDHLFRQAAAELATRYGRLIVDDVNVAEVARRPAPESDRYESRHDDAESQRQFAAPGLLRERMVAAFLARHGEVRVVAGGQPPASMLTCESVAWQVRPNSARKTKKLSRSSQV